MRLLTLNTERIVRITDVQIPVHEYNGRNASPLALVKLNSAVINANVSPVGPRKVIGCPQKRLYIMPETPHDKINSITPIVPSVIIFVRPPNATTGAKHVKNKKRIADRLF